MSIRMLNIIFSQINFSQYFLAHFSMSCTVLMFVGGINKAPWKLGPPPRRSENPQAGSEEQLDNRLALF